MRKGLIVIAVCVFVISSAVTGYAEDKWDNLLIESAKVFEDMTAMPDEGIPTGLLEDSYAIAIFPSTLAGGFVFGGQYGQGIIISKDKTKGSWSAPAVFNLAGVSWGLQIGGQATDIILLIMSERGLDGLLASKLKLGGDASVSAGPVGRGAEASTDLTMKSGILSYSRSRGAFVGIKFEGAVISQNNEANKSLYGTAVSAKEILVDQSVEPNEAASRLIKDLAKY